MREVDAIQVIFLEEGPKCTTFPCLPHWIRSKIFWKLLAPLIGFCFLASAIFPRQGKGISDSWLHVSHLFLTLSENANPTQRYTSRWQVTKTSCDPNKLSRFSTSYQVLETKCAGKHPSNHPSGTHPSTIQARRTYQDTWQCDWVRDWGGPKLSRLYGRDLLKRHMGHQAAWEAISKNVFMLTHSMQHVHQ